MRCWEPRNILMLMLSLSFRLPFLEWAKQDQPSDPLKAWLPAWSEHLSLTANFSNSISSLGDAPASPHGDVHLIVSKWLLGLLSLLQNLMSLLNYRILRNSTQELAMHIWAPERINAGTKNKQSSKLLFHLARSISMTSLNAVLVWLILWHEHPSLLTFKSW